MVFFMPIYHCCYCIRLENIFVGYCEWIYLYVSGIVVVTKQRRELVQWK